MSIRSFLSVSIVSLSLILSGVACSVRLIDFTVISSKNVTLKFQDGGKGQQRVKGSSMGFLGIGANVKAAVDEAIEKAGPGYDALIDGVVYKDVWGYSVEGTPINTTKLMAQLGKDGFEKYCMNHKIDFMSTK